MVSVVPSDRLVECVEGAGRGDPKEIHIFATSNRNRFCDYDIMTIGIKRGIICGGEHPFRPSTLSTPSRAHNIANIRMYKCANVRVDVKNVALVECKVSKTFQLRALANHLSYFGYGIAERLPIAAPPGGRSRIRAEGSEQEVD